MGALRVTDVCFCLRPLSLGTAAGMTTESSHSLTTPSRGTGGRGERQEVSLPGPGEGRAGAGARRRRSGGPCSVLQRKRPQTVPPPAFEGATSPRTAARADAVSLSARPEARTAPPRSSLRDSGTGGHVLSGVTPSGHALPGLGELAYTTGPDSGREPQPTTPGTSAPKGFPMSLHFLGLYCPLSPA